MTPHFEIIEAKRHHCGVIARTLRAEHQRVANGSGAGLHRELVACFDQSAFRKAWLIDGKLAALGGVISTLASPSGQVWLAMTDHATKYPVEIVKEARRQLAVLMRTKHEVMTTILLDDEPARRLAVFLGFHVRHEGLGAPALSNKARRELNRSLETFEDRILTIGKTQAVLMGYHDIQEA